MNYCFIYFLALIGYREHFCTNFERDRFKINYLFAALLLNGFRGQGRRNNKRERGGGGQIVLKGHFFGMRFWWNLKRLWVLAIKGQ